MKEGREWSGGTPLLSVAHFGFFVHLLFVSLFCDLVVSVNGILEESPKKSQPFIHFLFSLCEDLTTG